MNEILSSLKKLYESEIYKNFLVRKKLYEGKSVEVFYSDVISRVKLEYMGLLDENNNYIEYSSALNNRYVSRPKPFMPLVVGNNTLQAVTRLYAEFGANKEIKYESEDEKIIEVIDQIDFQNELSEAIALQSFAGKFLLKGIIKEKELFFQQVEPTGYFTIPDKINPKIQEKIVIFYSYQEKNKKYLKCEIYSKNKTEYRLFYFFKNILEEVKYPDDLEEYGCKKDGLGFSKTYEGWQVVEVHNLFSRSDYSDDLLTYNRELVIGDTLTSQAFDKVANPLLQVPDSIIDEEDTSIARERVIPIMSDDKDVKQVSLETKTAEWNMHKEKILEQIYISTGTNKQAFGLETLGAGAISGESKRRSMERVLSAIKNKRFKIYRAYEEVIRWGVKEILGKESDVKIISQDIIDVSEAESLANQNLKLDILTKINREISDENITEIIKAMKDDVLKKLGL